MNILILSRSSSLYSTKRLVESSARRGHNVRIVDYMRCYINISCGRPSLYFGDRPIDSADAVIPRIGASVTNYGATIVRQLEILGYFCVNQSSSIVNSRDKLKSIQILSKEGIPLPNTGFSSDNKDMDQVIEKVGSTPLIVKLLQGTQGQGVLLADSKKTAKAIMSAFMQLDAESLVQEFIKESSGVDIRAIVIGDQVVAAMKRVAPEGEFRSNLHQGGHPSPVKLTDFEEKVAIKASRILNLSISGVDFMRTKNGPLVLEVNSSPGLQGIENCTGIDVAMKMILFVEQEMKRIRERN